VRRRRHLKRHGEDAPIHAAMRADAILNWLQGK
jgi:hypothetical protein